MARFDVFRGIGHVLTRVIYRRSTFFPRFLPQMLSFTPLTYGQPGKFADFPDKTLKLNTLSTFFLLDKLRPGDRFLFLEQQ